MQFSATRSLKQVAIVTSLIIVASTLVVTQQPQQAPFSVLSPTENAIVSPSQTVQVALTPAPNVNIVSTLVFARGVAESANGIALTFAAPNRIGPMRLSIVAVLGNGEKAAIERTIYIEPSSAPSALSIEPQQVALITPEYPAVGVPRTQLYVTGQYPSAAFDLTKSINTTYVSANVGVARVDVSGMVVAVAPGRTSVTATHGSLSRTTAITVNIFELQGDLDGDSDIDANDLALILKARNQPASGVGDPRDLTNSGIIDALDARALTLRCSRPSCATQ